jgi:hypothetical protein
MSANSPSSYIASRGLFDRNRPKPFHTVTERSPAPTHGGDAMVFGDFRLVPSAGAFMKAISLENTRLYIDF